MAELMKFQLKCEFALNTDFNEIKPDIIESLVKNTNTPNQQHSVILEIIDRKSALEMIDNVTSFKTEGRQRINVYPEERMPSINILSNGGYYENVRVLETENYMFYIYKDPRKG